MGAYKVLTDYLPYIGNDDFGEWIIDRKSKGTAEDPIQMPYVSYSAMVRHFVGDVYEFMENHPEYILNHYQAILKANDIVWEKESMQDADISAFDGKCVMALIMGAVRADRFSEGALLSFFRSGTIAKWLLRLKEING